MVTVKSGIVGVARGIRAFFATNEISAVVRVGWVDRNRQTNQGPGGANRVVLIPGVFDATSGGPPKPLKAGRIDRDGPSHAYDDKTVRMRTVAFWHEAVTCMVWGVDPDFPTDEERQIEATEGLLELTLRALKNSVDPESGMSAGFANLETFGDAVWTMPPAEMSFGRELAFGFELLVPLYDQPYGKAYPQAAVSRLPAS